MIPSQCLSVQVSECSMQETQPHGVLRTGKVRAQHRSDKLPAAAISQKGSKWEYPLLVLFGSTARSRVAIVVNGDAVAGFHAAGFACFASCSNSFSSFASALYRVYMMAQMMAWPTAKMPATNAISAGVSTQPAA